MKRLFLTLATVALLVPGTALAKGKGGGGGGDREITVKKGTMQLGGNATFDLNSAGGTTSWGLNLSPSAGYFVTKGVEIVGGLNVGYYDAVTWNITGGARKFIDLKPNWAYVGGQAGYGDNGLGGGYRADLLGGVLMPLSKNVGLDLGGSLGYWEGGAIAVSAGYVGVQSFFKP